jgi:capsular polysaccharide biosynthesis protein
LGVPKGICSYRTHPHQYIYPPHELQRQAPRTLSAHRPLCFQPEEDNIIDESFVAILSEGISTAQGVNLTADGWLIDELSEQFGMRHPREHKLFKLRLKRLMPSITHVQGTVATLTIDRSRNYFHWMFDALPRLHLLSCAGSVPDKIYADTDVLFQRETLQHLGYPPERIISAREHPYISATQLIVPSFPCYRGPAPTWAVDYLRRLFLPAAQMVTKKRRLYVARDDAVRRRIVNREAVEAVLAEHDFEKITLEGKSFFEQMNLFRSAEAVVSPHGAGLTNLVFCDPGTKIIELFAPRFFFHTYWSLSCQAKLEYAYLVGEDRSELYSEQPLFDNIEINLDRLRQTLQIQRL